jgi:hypothetical protein
MEILIWSLLAAFVSGLLVSIVVYVAGDPNESLTRVTRTGVLVSGLTGLCCGFFFVVANAGGGESAGFLNQAINGLVVAGISGLAATPTFFVVFFLAELLHQIRSARSTRVITPKFRRLNR